MDPQTEFSRHLTRREFFGRQACGLGTAALASLLAKEGRAVDAPAAGAALRGARVGGLPELPHCPEKAKRVIL